MSQPLSKTCLRGPSAITRAQELWLSTVTARRFCDQQEMSLHTATGRSLPYEMVCMRCAMTPREIRYSRTVWDRRAPSAMLYSRVPRSSAWPSIVNA